MTVSKLFQQLITGEVIVRDAASGKILQQFTHDAYVNAIAISHNGDYLATVSDDRSAAVWNLRNGERLHHLAHTDEVWTVAFIQAEKILLTGSKDGLLRVFDVTTGNEIDKLKFDGSIIAIRY